MTNSKPTVSLRSTLPVPTPTDKVFQWNEAMDVGDAIEDARLAAREAVESPVDFPALTKILVPEDSVTLAVDPNIPSLVEVVGGIVDSLPLADLGYVRILLSEEATEETIESLRVSLPEAVAVVRHQGDQQEDLAYLAANEAGDPLYLNKDLTHADFVLPVVLKRSATYLDSPWQAGGVSPALSDTTSRKRFRYERMMRPGTADKEAFQVSALLGFQLLVVAEVDSAGNLIRVRAGTVAGLEKEFGTEATGQEIGEDLLHDLVLAYVDGDAQQQSWENLARSLDVARGEVRPGGTIVLVTALEEKPTGALRRLQEMRTGDEDDLRKFLLKVTDRQASTAALLLDAQREGRLLLYSKLPGERIEPLGLGAIEDATALQRVVDSHESCLIIRNAQFANGRKTKRKGS